MCRKSRRTFRPRPTPRGRDVYRVQWGRLPMGSGSTPFSAMVGTNTCCKGHRPHTTLFMLSPSLDRYPHALERRGNPSWVPGGRCYTCSNQAVSIRYDKCSVDHCQRLCTLKHDARSGASETGGFGRAGSYLAAGYDGP